MKHQDKGAGSRGAVRRSEATSPRPVPGAGALAMRRQAAILPALLGLVLPSCRPAEITFPDKPLAASQERVDYDTDGDGKADFFCFPDASGRFDRIAYDRDRDGQPDDLVHLAAVDIRSCRRLVLVLDGIPFDVVREFYESGHLRFLHPPAVLIPPYPVMTDLALEDAFAYLPCAGCEAKYYDRARNRVVGGTGAYLAGENEPFARIIDYRAGTLLDGLAYLNPRAAFEKELADVKRLLNRRAKQETIAYLVSSAAMGTRMGKEGQLATLRRCEQLVNQLFFETGGLVQVTIFADHGQTNVPAKPAGLARHLRAKGWRVTESLKNDNDVVLIEFGLVTYAALSTRKPAKLVEDLLLAETVELASYVEGDAVVVATREGKATVRSADGKMFRYEATAGDPLGLKDIVPPEGEADGRSVLKITCDGKHPYPDALYRLWRAHFGLVEHPPDVIVSLVDRYYNGASTFSGAVSIASTHGGLNWRNSATFIMSSAGAVEGPLRSEDIPGVVEKLHQRRRPFPDRQ